MEEVDGGGILGGEPRGGEAGKKEAGEEKDACGGERLAADVGGPAGKRNWMRNGRTNRHAS